MTSEDAPCRHLPARFARRVVTLAPGEERPYVDAEWRDALVLVERGEIELVCTRGGHRRFGAGSILWFVDLSLALLRNRGPETTVLIATSRR